MKKRLLSITLAVCSVIFFMISPTVNAKASVSDTPHFTIENWKTTPNPANKGEDITVSGTLKPEPFEVDIPEKDIVLVLDVSGSMDDPVEAMQGWMSRKTKMAALKDAAVKFINTLHENQKGKNVKISVVTYSDNAEVKTNPWFMDLDTQSKDLDNIIGSLRAGGGTNTGEGLRKAAFLLQKQGSDKNKTVVLMSDGLPTYRSITGDTIPAYQITTDQYTKTVSEHEVGFNYWGDAVWEDSYTETDSEHKKTVGEHYEVVDGDKLKKVNESSILIPKKTTKIPQQGDKSRARIFNTINGYSRTIWRDIKTVGAQRVSYHSLDNTNPQYDGGGSYDDGTCAVYAREMGNILKTHVNNVFSVGYGLGNSDSEGNKTLKSIHESMGAPDTNYYPTSDDISGIFTTIADEIMKKYAINNIKLSMKLNSGFSLNVGGNTVNMPAVEYKLDKEENGKAIYSADPVDFNFIVKGDKNGNDQKILESADLEFKWKDTDKKIAAEKLPTVNIKNDLFPVIKAELISPEKYKSKIGNSEIVQYKIEPQSFKYTKNDYDGKKEVVFLIDTSSNMKGLDTLWKNGCINDMVNALSNTDVRKTKALFNIITYDSSVNMQKVDTEEKDNNNVPINYKDKIRSIVDGIQISDNSERKLGKALSKAKEVLDGGDADARKNIVIIAAGNPTDSIPKDYINNNYNIITLSINKTKDSGNEYSDINNWHKTLGGSEQNYFFSPNKDGHNDIANSITGKMAERLENYNISVRRFKDVAIHLNFGSDLEYVDNSINGLKISKSGQALTINLPEIDYYIEGNINEGRYTYTAEPIQCSFRVKIKKFTGSTAQFLNRNDTDYNNIAYTKITGEYEKEAIKTPVFINALNIIHGVYKGNQVIDTSNSLSFAKGTVVPMAASFTYYNSIEPQISVVNGSIVSNPVIYILDKSTKELRKTAEFTKIDSTVVNAGLSEGDTVYILYKIRLSDSINAKSNKCTSTITADDNKFPAVVTISDDSIPDLY